MFELVVISCSSNLNISICILQLAILAGYSNDELLSIYRYFRSLAVDNPFTTARDNLVIAFDKVKFQFLNKLDNIINFIELAFSTQYFGICIGNI